MKLNINKTVIPLILISFLYLFSACEETEPNHIGSSMQDAFDGMVFWEKVSSFNADNITAVCHTEMATYAATRSSGLYRSTDMLNWQQVYSGNDTIISIAAIGNNVICCSDTKLLYSSNGETGWQSYSAFETGLTFNVVASSDNNFYAGTSAGLYYSNNTMSNWQLFPDSLPDGPVSVNKIQFDNGNNIIAVANNKTLYKYDVNTNDWMRLRSDNKIFSVLPLEGGEIVILNHANILLSKSNGGNWQTVEDNYGRELFKDMYDNVYLADAYLHGNFATGNYFIGRSVNQGRNWIPFDSGIEDEIAKIIYDDSGYLYAISNAGNVYRTMSTITE